MERFQKFPYGAVSEIPLWSGFRKFPMERFQNFPMEGFQEFPSEGFQKFPSEGFQKFLVSAPTRFSVAAAISCDDYGATVFVWSQ